MPDPTWPARNSQATGRTTANLDVSAAVWEDGVTAGFTTAFVPTFFVPENDATLTIRATNDTADRTVKVLGGVPYPIGLRRVAVNANVGAILIGKGE